MGDGVRVLLQLGMRCRGGVCCRKGQGWGVLQLGSCSMIWHRKASEGISWYEMRITVTAKGFCAVIQI
jgi:hypothetical protein